MVIEDGTYRQMHGARTTYTVKEITDDGCRVVTDDSYQFTTPASELGLVEAVEGSVGGIEVFVPYEETTGEVRRRLKEEAFVLGVECRAEELEDETARQPRSYRNGAWKTTNAVFPSRQSNHISKTSVWRMVKKTTKAR